MNEKYVLIVSALTDFIIVAATGVTTAMVATGAQDMPSKATVFISVLGGLVSFARTIQQALRPKP